MVFVWLILSSLVLFPRVVFLRTWCFGWLFYHVCVVRALAICGFECVVESYQLFSKPFLVFWAWFVCINLV